MSLLGEMVGQRISCRDFMPLWARASFTFSPPFKVYSEITKASIFGYWTVTPKGSFNSNRFTQSSGFTLLMNFYTRCILISHGSRISLDFFLASSACPVIPMWTSLLAESAVQSSRTWCPTCRWSKVPPTATVANTGTWVFGYLRRKDVLMVGNRLMKGKKSSIFYSLRVRLASGVSSKVMASTNSFFSNQLRALGWGLSRSINILLADRNIIISIEQPYILIIINMRPWA